MDRLGIFLFLLHLAVSAYILLGWAIPSTRHLMFYLVLLPAVAMQWLVNRSSCVINNIETWVRTGRWRDAANPEEGRFVSMLIFWLFGVRLNRTGMDTLCYSTIIALWFLALAHLAVLGDQRLLSLFPR